MRGFLIGESGALEGQRIPLDKPRVVLGRDAESCDFVLTQAFISKQHVALDTDEDGLTTARDLGSRLGIFVNGKPVLEQVLASGDQLGLGPGGVLSFRFLPPAPPAVPAVTGSTPTAQALRSQFRAAAERSGPVIVAAPETPHGHPPAHPRAATAAEDAAVLRLGRATDNQVVLDGLGVSRYHASLTYKEGRQPTLADLGSTNGTYLNGEFLREPKVIAPSDLVFIGGFLMRVDGRTVHQFDLSSSRICAQGITKRIGEKVLLRDVTLALFPREFVGLMGPSGCGKSTLMDALNGLRPATSGSVSINKLDLYKHFNSLRRSIGYVPQRDILHDALTVERTLYYSAKLRLPDGTSDGDVHRVVDDVIGTVGLGEQRATQFKQLSGGQQKRLSLGVELITKPSFLFLDEPTSPLDPESTESMMLLFRKLADEGRIVVMVTHKFEKFYEMHHVAILARGGHLAFFGPPRVALEYFGCREPADIYRKIGGDPEELGRRFKASSQYQTYVHGRLADASRLDAPGQQTADGVAAESASATRRPGLAQWLVLTRRFLEIKLKDRRNTALLLVQAPAIALILAVITGNKLNDAKALFISAIISIWFGANNAIRDIVSESPIYVRERRFNLKIPSYVFSKFAVLSGIGLIQTILFLGILINFHRLSAGDFPALLAILYLTSLGGISSALFLSALVNSTEKAMSILPLVLIPQLLLSGFFKPVGDVYFYPRTGKPATAEAFQRYEDAKGRMAGGSAGTLAFGRSNVPDVVTKKDGLGPAGPVSAVVMARWSMDGLVHAVSVNDADARNTLASTVYVPGYQAVFDGKDAASVAHAYRVRVWLDLSILAAFNAILLALTVWALKRKDVL